MAAFAEDRARRWEPFGVTDADFEAVPERRGVKVVNVAVGGGRGPGQAGGWLRGAAIALAILAAAAAVVSWDAQYQMVRAVKHFPVVAALEAGIPDVGAVVFAALGVALALHGSRAVRPRALNAACIGISLTMNALAAGHGWRDLAIWVMPAAVYAVASDTLIGVVRAWVLARVRNQGETLADDGPTPLAMVGGLALWLLRLSLAPISTLSGFRGWVVRDCPVAPGISPGHAAELQAVQQDAARQIALTASQRDEAVRRAEAEAQEARHEATRARAAEAVIRAELDQARAEAVTQRDELRAWSERQADALRAELERVREDAASLVGQVRDAAAKRIAALEEARGELRAERDQFAAALRTSQQVRQPASRAVRARDPRALRGGGPTKRHQMIELAGQRRDLAAIPQNEVSRLASSVAGEIGYSAGTARRELARHVRELQAASAGSTEENETTNENEGGEAQ